MTCIFVFYFHLSIRIVTGCFVWIYKKINNQRTKCLYSRITDQGIEDTININPTETTKDEALPPQDYHTLTTSLAMYACILAYFYLCDRYNANYYFYLLLMQEIQ